MSILHQPLTQHRRTRIGVDNRIAYLDQTSFLGLRAFDYKELIQFTWVYDRPIDIDALRRFHHNLGYGMMGRRIERSPLPFARDRWVVWRGQEDIDIAPTPRPRSQVSTWADERVHLPIDPEWGPSWHLGVLPLADNGTAISLVASHTVVDAVGMSLAVADAAEGRMRDLGYPPPGSRTPMRAVFADGRQTIASLPEMARALAATAQLVRRQRQDFSSSVAAAPPSPRATNNEKLAVVPGITVYVDLADWDRRAEALGGTSNSLFAGIAAKLGASFGRVLDDGTATLFCPVSERTDNDTRGNALTYAVVTVDPTPAARDLTEVRRSIKQALTELATTPNESLSLLPLIPSVPEWAARRLVGLWQGSGASTIGCSNVGELNPAVNRPDGTDADYLSIRLTWDGIRKPTMDRIGGKLFLLSGRVHGKISIAITACLVDQEITEDNLREAAIATFNEFDLPVEIE